MHPKVKQNQDRCFSPHPNTLVNTRKCCYVNSNFVQNSIIISMIIWITKLPIIWIRKRRWARIICGLIFIIVCSMIMIYETRRLCTYKNTLCSFCKSTHKIFTQDRYFYNFHSFVSFLLFGSNLVFRWKPENRSSQ